MNARTTTEEKPHTRLLSASIAAHTIARQTVTSFDAVARRAMELAAFGLLVLISLPAQGTIITGTSDLLNGHPVTVFADVNGNNQLNSVGYLVSGAAVRDPGLLQTTFFLNLPSVAGTTGFTTLRFDWNPQGHEPPQIYGLPHFDFHFYYIPDSLRTTIPANETSPVAPQFLPAGYSQPGPTVPEMGGHSDDLTSPEFNGGTFTHTFIYGYFRGQEIFLEPMLTQAYLQGLSGSSTFPIRQPRQYALTQIPALIPGSVQYAYDGANDVYAVSVGNFFSPASEVPEPGTLVLLSLGILVVGSRRVLGRRHAPGFPRK